MTEQHECEWTFSDHKIYDYECTICGSKGTRGWALSRLNEYETLKKATDALTADDISLILFVMVENSVAFNASPERQRITKALQTYADILERK